MSNIKQCGNGEVVLIYGGGKTYSDKAAKFCRSGKSLDDIVASESNKNIIKTIIDSGHNAVLEFDDFIFGIAGYSRVTEAQLIRKRHASYMIGSGRSNKKNSVDVVLPNNILDIKTDITLDSKRLMMNNKDIYSHLTDAGIDISEITYELSTYDILDMIESWYTRGSELNIPHEDLRFMKPQATEFKGIVKMNASGLRDWAKIRMCNRAQHEIRDLCTKMINLAKEASPELMSGVGASCVHLGYCPELEQCEELVGKIPLKKQALEYLRKNRNEICNI